LPTPLKGVSHPKRSHAPNIFGEAERPGDDLDELIDDDDDIDVAEAHALLLVDVRTQGKPRGARDLMIAATAKAFDRTIVSADATAFLNLPGIEVRFDR